ncbi:MAG: hypothetical protein OZ927_17475 [Alcaligenaceae bacterium]|nr:hypothetical protein [Alcaligenaceae bacterium]
MNRYWYASMAGGRQIGLKALLLAFLLRALVPAGYMPVFLFAGHAAPALTVTLCVKGLPGSVIETLALDTQHGHAEPQDLDCAFGSAVGHAYTPPPAAAAFLLPDLVSEAPPPAPAGEAGSRRTPGPPLGSRAPPFVV